MSKKLLTPQDVLGRIGAEDFRSISKEQLISFVSSLPDMDSEVAFKCIEQFPEFKSCAKDMVGYLNDTCSKAMSNQKDNLNKVIDGYQKTIDALNKRLEKPELTLEEEQYIAETIITLGQHMGDLLKEHASFLKHLINVVAGVSAFVIGIAAALLGLKIHVKK